MSTQDEPSIAEISNALLNSQVRDRWYGEGVVLTRKGRKQWEERVVPALKVAFDRASGSSGTYLLRDTETVDLNQEAYDYGLNSSMGGYKSIDLDSMAMMMIDVSNAFACERFACGTREKPNRPCIVKSEVLERERQERLNDFFKDNAPENALESYLAGVAAGAVTIYRLEQERIKREQQPNLAPQP